MAVDADPKERLEVLPQLELGAGPGLRPGFDPGPEGVSVKPRCEHSQFLPATSAVFGWEHPHHAPLVRLPAQHLVMASFVDPKRNGSAIWPAKPESPYVGCPH